ncbi:WecB/TagA/CpsF family glycosyltransferase [Mesobacillus thioparans]|uniref:WecB/TagA/CpsF family glycosyltransferase n=1 Tax=Mesobacillus thioparans TaxID=370439 RepID=UPI0039F125DB
MENTKISILGIPFTNITFDDMADKLAVKILNKEKTFVVTANPEIVMFAKRNREYEKIIKCADDIVPDGFGVLLASSIQKTPIKERVTGYDLTIRLLEMCAQNSWSVYLLGGKEEINAAAADNIKKNFKGLKLVGRHHGYFSGNEEGIVKEIQNKEPDLVLVALGFPRQEQWISSHLSSFQKGVFMGVGGSIDVLSGTVKRAPGIWRKLNLEWLYRLLKQPSRWRRMLVLPIFVLEVLRTGKKKSS